MIRMRRLVAVTLLLIVAGCHHGATPGKYLYVWAGDSAGKASDFLAVLDADPGSTGYGTMITSLPTGSAGTMPHHTEAEMPADGHLLANGFVAGKTWLFDLTEPRAPKIATSFGDLAGFRSSPYVPSPSDRQRPRDVPGYLADSTTAAVTMPGDGQEGMAMPNNRRTGGLIEMDERGKVIRSASAADTMIADRFIYPYSVLTLPAIDRAISTTTGEHEIQPSSAPENWIQYWRLSDLKLLKTIGLPKGERNVQNYAGEVRLLPDGKSVYIHTFNCGLYFVHNNVDSCARRAGSPYSFPGEGCGVPILTSHYWLRPVPKLHALVALDISDPEHPRQLSSVIVGNNDEEPHWIAIDPTGTRIVLNSAGAGTGDRLFIINLDRTTGSLSLDERFRDPGAKEPGVTMRGKEWIPGFHGTAVPHGTVFSR